MALTLHTLLRGSLLHKPLGRDARSAVQFNVVPTLSPFSRQAKIPSREKGLSTTPGSWLVILPYI